MTPNSFPSLSSRVKTKATGALFTFLVIFTMLLSACGGGNAQNNQANSKTILKIATQSYDFAQAGFNPYNGHPNPGVLGLVYETFDFFILNYVPVTPKPA